VGGAQVLLTVGPQRLRLKLAGEAHSFEAPFDTAAFDPRRPAPESWPSVVQTQGEALWTAAFSGSLGLLLDRAATQAAEAGSSPTLRIVPAADLPPHLRWLPWETMFDPARRDYLALKSGWSLVRGLDPFEQSRQFGPGDAGVFVLDLMAAPAREEIEGIERAVGGRGRVEVHRPGDTDELLRLLGSCAAPVVHVIGVCQGEGLLLGEAPDEYVGGREIAVALAANAQVTLVVLSASASELVAEKVAGHALTTVLAHRSLVRAEHARAVSETFCQRLFDGLPADLAVTDTRRALDRQFPGERGWTSAVLLTGWPPPRLVPAAPVHEEVAPRRPAADDLSPEALRHLLYSTNRNRTAALLEVVDWEPLRRQHDEAVSWFTERRGQRAP